MKIYYYGAGHMAKMAAMLIYGENPSKIFFLYLLWPDLNKTWYVAFGTPAYRSLYK